jgi:DNA polymerase-3 subunit alpha
MKPETFMDLAAVNALSRPGPLHSGSTGDYIAIRHGRMKREDLHPIVAKICEATEGQIIYQEQILQITRDVGKFPWTHASAIRKIISSKKGESAFNAMWDDFKKGAAESDIDEKTAAEIWKRMATAGTYAFNIAHCVGYSILGFWSMWLKTHHPLEFYASQLHKTPIDSTGKALALMRDFTDIRFGRKYKILPPHPKRSDLSWKPVYRKGKPYGIRAGIYQIPGIGENKAKAIIDYRDEHGLESWDDIGNIKGFGPVTVAKIAEFCSREDPFEVDGLKNDIAAIQKAIKDGDLPGVPYPKSKAEDIPYEARSSNHIICGKLKAKNLQDYFENHRSRTGEELDPATVTRPEDKEAMTLYLDDDTGAMTVKATRFDYPHLKDKLYDLSVGDYVVAVTEKFPFLGKTQRIVNLWVLKATEE